MLCQALGSRSVPTQPLPHPGSLCALVQFLCTGAAGMWQRLHRSVRAEGTQGLGAPGRAHTPASCSVQPVSLFPTHPSTVRAAQSRLPPLPSCFAITAGSRWEMRVAGGAAGTGIGARIGAGAPCQDQWAASQPSSGLSSEAAAEPSVGGTVLGDSDGGSEWGTVPAAHTGLQCPGVVCPHRGAMPRDCAWGALPGVHTGGPYWGTGAAAVPQRHISALLTTTVSPKSSCPQAITILLCQQPLLTLGTLAHISPLLQSSLPLEWGWGPNPLQPWHTQAVSDGAEQHFVLSHLPAAS